VLKENLRVKLKNKGSQEHKPGPKLDKYQTPKPEHPNTKNKISNAEIHANHAEGKMRLSVVKTQLIVEKLIRTLKSRMVYNEPLIYTGLYITLYANILQQKRFLL
jgi:hypothetical protein